MDSRYLGDGLFHFALYGAIKIRETIPGDRGFKGVSDNAERGEAIAPVRHADKGIAPRLRRALLFILCSGGIANFTLQFAAVVAGDFKGALHAVLDLMVCRLEAQYQHRTRFVGHLVAQHLLLVEQTAVGRK